MIILLLVENSEDCGEQSAVCSQNGEGTLRFVELVIIVESIIPIDVLK